jgi:hypothetical protein
VARRVCHNRCSVGSSSGSPCRKALGNLLDNALRYVGNAEVRLSEDGDAVVLEIADDGPGIPKPNWDASSNRIKIGSKSLFYTRFVHQSSIFLSLRTPYPFPVENVCEFEAFLLDCGGFAIC